MIARARIAGANFLSEIPVLFATDRKRDGTQPAVAFSSARDSDITSGRVTVVVPTDELRAQVVAQRVAKVKSGKSDEFAAPNLDAPSQKR